MSEEIIKHIVLLSGPVGAGKTTVAQELIKAAVDPTVYIEGDKFWFFIVKGDKPSEEARTSERLWHRW